MTLNNKNWVKNEVFRLYLSAYSQEDIAKELNISVGTVNSLVSEILKSDDT
jgi:DNA-directed RNA polymerase specialized sigma24 family protein